MWANPLNFHALEPDGVMDWCNFLQGAADRPDWPLLTAGKRFCFIGNRNDSNSSGTPVVYAPLAVKLDEWQSFIDGG